MALSKKKRRFLEELSYEDRIMVRDFYDERFKYFRNYIYENDFSLDDVDYYLTIKFEDIENDEDEEVEEAWHGRDFWNFCMDLFSVISEINEKRDRN